MAAVNGTMYFIGLKSGITYNVDVYISDVANQSVRFNPTGTAGASSTDYWRAPEDIVLRDFAVASGTTTATSITMTQDGAIRNGTILKFAAFLTTLNNRPSVSIPFPAGALVGAVQNA